MQKRASRSFPYPKVRVHSWPWAVTTILLAALELLWPDRVWVTLLIILAGTWLGAFIWTRSLSRNLVVKREMRYGWAQVGDVLQERYTLTNASLLPALWMEVQDHSNLPDYPPGRVTSIGLRETMSWRTEGICTRRGLYMLGPTSLRTGDPLGLFSTQVHLPDSTVLMVLPPVLPLPAIEIAAGGWSGEGTRTRRAALETAISVETVHEYVPGDPLRAIHWPTSARKAALYVRKFDHMPLADWWIFLDLEARVQVGSGADSTEEHGVILAASLVDRGIRQGKKVGLVTCGQELTWLPPRNSSAQLMDILRALAVIHPGQRSLEDLLSQAAQSIRRGASVIVITPNTEAGWIAHLLPLVRNNILPTVLLLDPASFGDQAGTGLAGTLLSSNGIPHMLIPRELLDRPESRPGQQGQWRWNVVGFGKAVAVHRPADGGWRRLG